MSENVAGRYVFFLISINFSFMNESRKAMSPTETVLAVIEINLFSKTNEIRFQRYPPE